MRIDPKARLFLGLKIDSKLREALAQATPGDRHYFDDPSGQYLRIVSLGEEQWIGKVMDGGLPPNEIEDIQRNISSILNRIAPGSRHSASAMRMFTVEEGPPAITPSPAPGHQGPGVID